jgi:hypothetical protein
VLLADWVLPPAAAVDYCNVVDKSAFAVLQPDYDLMISLDTILAAAAALHYFVVAVAAMMMAEVDAVMLEQELQQFVVVVDDLEKAAMIQYEVAAAPNYPELVWMMEPHEMCSYYYYCN